MQMECSKKRGIIKFFPEHLACMYSNLFDIQLEYQMSTYDLQNF